MYNEGVRNDFAFRLKTILVRENWREKSNERNVEMIPSNFLPLSKYGQSFQRKPSVDEFLPKINLEIMLIACRFSFRLLTVLLRLFEFQSKLC